MPEMHIPLRTAKALYVDIIKMVSVEHLKLRIDQECLMW